MIIEAIRTYFLGCPLIEDDKKINVDYLGIEAVEYTIDPTPTPPIVKEYVDGSSIRQYTFVFASREYYGANTLVNIENSGFYEKLSSWVEEQNAKEKLPILGDEKESMEMSISTPGYLFDATEDRARYQIQMTLKYYQGGN